ncbi:MAG: hypothetical protein IPO80_04880 [Propionibacteriaceae bacterium]|nr:hypothetical protein [Propionibacteriaceae bacterium]
MARRAPDATALCSTCVRRDPGTWEPCSGCGRTRPVNARTDDRAPLCPTCYTSPVDTCDLCGRAAPISSRLGGTVVCRYCYRGHTDRCGRCHHHTVCRTLPDLGIICLSCLLTQRVDDLLTGEDGTINAIWDPLRTALAIGWLYRSPAVAVLQEMGTGASPVSHTTLDRAAGQARYASGVEHLRGLLVGVTILPERDNHLLRLEQRLATLVAAAHPDDRQVLTLYARWRLIPRVRRASHAGKHTGSRSGGAHTALRMVAGHLDWLRRHQVGLADSTQAHVDQWAATHPGHTSTVRTFLRWAAANRRTPRHDLAVPDNSHPHVFSTDDQRWALTRQALADHTWTVSDRVAAALILLYAQTPSRIATLTRRDLGTDNEGRLTLRLGADPITVPPPLDQLLTQLPEPQRHGLAATVILDQEWLFPGSRPGRHVDPTTVMRRLRLHGIHPRAARNTALLQLATETPTPVIADLLGLNLNTAEKWREVAGARWANYPSRRP